MNESKWFTIYWLGGTKSYVFGPTIDQAFTDAGYGAGASPAIDFYDNGISCSHYYDKTKKEWVSYKEFKCGYSDFLLKDLDELLNLCKEHNDFIVTFDTDDILVFKKDWGLFYLDGQTRWVEYLSLSFGEYFKGTYAGDSDDEENAHHFMMANTQYFAPENIAFALETFMKRAKQSPFRIVNTPYSETLEDIQLKQKVSYNQ